MAKKITIRFPDEHPILQAPEGSRSERIRALVDLALTLENKVETLEKSVESIENHIITNHAEIKKLLSKKTILEANEMASSEDDDKNEIEFDHSGFMDI